jgi:hypothetical protein
VKLAMAILMLFIGACLIWVAVHGTTATTPWEVFQQVLDALQGKTTESGREESTSVDGTDMSDGGAGSGNDPSTNNGIRTNSPAGPA